MKPDKLPLMAYLTVTYSSLNTLWMHVRALVLISVCAVWSGCAGGAGPEVISVPANEYQLAFDSAVEVARNHGMRPAFLDRRAGIIETEPVIAGSLLEPWYGDNADLSQAMRNTIARNRYRARFEFTRAGFKPRTTDDGIPPVDLLGVTNDDWDLTAGDGPLDLRAWVFEERGHSVGQRRNAWSFIGTSYTYKVPVEGNWEENQVFFWTPTTRDRPAERRLLAEVRDRMDAEESMKKTASQETAAAEQDEPMQP